MFDLAGISLKNYGTENWTARDSSRAWIDIAIGSTGQYQAAVSYNNLYLSSNYGTTWTENTSAGSRNWNSIAISSNGQFITAIAGGDIYISINSGVNWTYTYKPFGRQYTSVCMSDNGQYQLVGGSNINPHVSYNYGYSWTPILYVYNWFVVGMSADGKYQFADSYESGLFYSVDYGANWNIMAEYPTGGVLKSISVSSTGQYVTVAEDSQIYISSNFGASWTQKETTKNWYSVAISGNGQIQLASLYNQGQIYISTDFGNTWVPKGTARIWCGGVAISSNGQYITGSVFNGQIYTYNSADSGLSSAITSLSTGLSTGLSSEISSRLSGDASLSIKLSEMAEGMSGDTTSSTELSSEVSSIRSLLGRPPIMSYTTLPSYLPTQMGYYGTFTGDLPAIKTGVTPGIFTLLTSTGLTLQPGNYIFNFQICYSISNTGYISNIYAGLTTSNIAFVGSGNFYVIGSQYIPSPRSFPNVLYNVCRHLQVATETTFYLATSIMFEGSEMQILGSNNYATFLKVG